MLPIEAETPTAAWVKAVENLVARPGHRMSRIILEISNPIGLTSQDADVCKLLDRFVVGRGGLPLNTVANTIFPYGLFHRHGVPAFYDEYRKVYPKLKKHCDHRPWGTYFYRMTTKSDGKGEVINPLQYLIGKLKKITNKAAYEVNFIDLPADIPIYEASLDKHHPVGGPCLSHVSFSVSDEGRLDATALYRSHYYIQRALGNLFGLAYLLDFVAQQSEYPTGTLTCISNTAQLEPGKWKKAEVEDFVAACVAAESASSEAA